MTVNSNAAAPVADGMSLHDRVRDSLLQSGVLTPDGAAQIEETMQSMGLEFGDAALHLGLVTYAELAAALESTRRTSAGRSDGIIEGALQMLAGARSLPVKYHGIVRAGPTLSWWLIRKVRTANAFGRCAPSCSCSTAMHSAAHRSPC